jgi:hypothetical protein
MSEFENDEKIDKPSKNKIYKQIINGLTLNSSYIPPIIYNAKESSAKDELEKDIGYKEE